MPFEVVYVDKPVSHGSHTHVYDELLYVQEGEVSMTIRGATHQIGPGSLVFLNQFDDHSTQILTEPYKRYYLLIPPAELTALHSDVQLFSVFRLHGPGFPYVLNVYDRKSRFALYFRLLLDVSREEGAYVDMRMQALIALILTEAQAVGPKLFPAAEDLSFLPLQEILDELDEKFAEPFSLENLAKRLHVSASCLSSHFRQYVGMSPMQYVTQRRLNHAKVLLLKTSLSVMKIGTLCGYNDVSNFVRRFRKQYGCTPLQFRSRERDSTAARMARHISIGPGLEHSPGL